VGLHSGMTPIPFHCHDCDRMTMNECGVCDRCLEEMKQDMLEQFKKPHEQESIEYFFTKWDKEKKEEKRENEDTKAGQSGGNEI